MTTRRTFLLRAGLGAAAFAALPDFALPRARAANDQIRIGLIGVGNQGMGNLKVHANNAVAVCDVDANHLAKAKEAVEKATKKKCAAYSDYRKLLEDKSVDAVVITTPDHWHALMTIDACAAQKDVYCEKPLTLTIAEGRAMVKAAREHKRIVQTGSQQRSDAKFRQACELVRNGKIGKVKAIKVGIAGVNFKGDAVKDSDPPKHLDFPTWLGPAPLRPYNERRVHYNFRFFWDYSGGQMTNWGAHHLDIAQWGLGMDDSGPVTIEGTAKFNDKKLYEVPQWCKVTYVYASGTVMTCEMGGRGGTEFIGEKGTIFVTRGKIEAKPTELLKEDLTKADVKLYVSKNHHANWLECVRSRKLPICDVEIGHRSATVCHLGNVAIRSGKKFTWDPAKERTDDEEAMKLVSKKYRAPWKLPD